MYRFLALALIFTIGCSGEDSSSPILIFQPVTEEPADSRTPISSNPGPIELPDPPPSFGNAGPEAFLRISPRGQDHHGEFEIIFSHPMDLASVQSGFSLISDGGVSPAGPAPGGTLTFLNYRQAIFTPYAPLQENEGYQVSLPASVQTSGGDSLISDSQQLSFHTRPWFEMQHTVNGMPHGQRGIAIDNSGSPAVILSSTWTNGGFISRISLHRLSGGEIEICTDCSAESYTLNLAGSSIPPEVGISQYYYQIEAEDGTVRHYPFAFSYGDMAASPGAMQSGTAAAFLDGQYLLPTLSRTLERFAAQHFLLNGNTFNNFANESMTSTKRSGCIDYGGFSFVRSYGNGPGANGDGYCGYFVDDGAELCADVGLVEICSDSDVTLDVYVTAVNIPATSDGNENIQADISVPAGTENARVSLSARKAYLDLRIVANLEDGLVCVGACIVSENTKIEFSAKAELNRDHPNSPRTSVSLANIESLSDGSLTLTINEPYGSPNFVWSDWTDHLTVYDLSFVDSTSWVADLLSSVVESIGNDIVPLVKPDIVRDVLKDFKQRIAINVLNAFLSSLASQGVTLGLPSYLPAPLNQLDLAVRIQLEQNSDLIKSLSWKDGGFLSSLQAGMFVTNNCGTCETPSDVISPALQGPQSFISNPYTLDPSYLMNKSSTQPGTLLALHEDSLNQLLYELWSKGGLNLTLDEPFITQVNSYAGEIPSLTLTSSLLRAGTLLNVLAPGRDTLIRLDGGASVTINDDDAVELRLRPRQVPYIRMLPSFTPGGTRELQLQVSDLEIQIWGTQGPSVEYLMATIMAHATVNGTVDLVGFSNPTSNPSLNNLQALNVALSTDELYYTIQVMDGASQNPMGLSPDQVQQVALPLVRSLIVPLLNNVLKEVPLPATAGLSTFTSGGSNCGLNLSTDRILVDSLPVNDTSVPMILLRLRTPTSLYQPGITNPDVLENLIGCN
ncbi:MAG: Ig-like domain-containing protein [Leptospiraceae bacterium]